MSFTIDVVAHCWRYERLLCHHLSAYLFSPPPSEITVNVKVCASFDDEPVRDVLKLSRWGRFPKNVHLQPQLFPSKLLCRRAIARNELALATTADWVWFADIDYIPRQAFWRALVYQLKQQPPEVLLAYPHRTGRSSQAGGDNLIKAVNLTTGFVCWASDQPCIPVTNGDEILGGVKMPFLTERTPAAIGGIQFVRGSYCREHGYLNAAPRWHRPEKQWKRTFEDPAFRRAIGSEGTPIVAPGLLRIRHTQRGRTDVGVRL